MYFCINYLLHDATPNIFMLTLVTSIAVIRCSWTEFEIIKQKISIDEKEISHPSKVEVGSNVNLTCQTSRAFEYCTWSHKDKECKFEWKQVRIIISIKNLVFKKLKYFYSFQKSYLFYHNISRF